jgi:hypothetical protein
MKVKRFITFYDCSECSLAFVPNFTKHHNTTSSRWVATMSNSYSDIDHSHRSTIQGSVPLPIPVEFVLQNPLMLTAFLTASETQTHSNDSRLKAKGIISSGFPDHFVDYSHIHHDFFNHQSSEPHIPDNDILLRSCQNISDIRNLISRPNQPQSPRNRRLSFNHEQLFRESILQITRMCAKFSLSVTTDHSQELFVRELNLCYHRIKITITQFLGRHFTRNRYVRCTSR